MWGFRVFNILLIGLILSLSSCKKKEKEYVYKVDKVNVSQAGADKPNVKTSTEYISIAYSDIFDANIPTNRLDDLKQIYIAFGDVGVTEDLIIRNFIADPAANIPSIVEMNANPSQFVINAYKKVFNREPSEYELWFMTDCISKDASVTPEVIYYALMTSNEYRQF